MTGNAQGSDGLELVPAVMPTFILIDNMNPLIARYLAEGTILQTLLSRFEYIIPIHVKKQVWILDTLKQFDSGPQ